MQVVTCLTRDSYLTHCFLQHLMAVLSSLERTPSPEPVDRDFYSEFGNKTTGTRPAPAAGRPSGLTSWAFLPTPKAAAALEQVSASVSVFLSCAA